MRFGSKVLLSLGGLALGQPLAAQETSPEKDDKVVLDLTLHSTLSAGNEECTEQADAATITGDIVVCRSLGETTDGSFDLDAFQRDYANRTQGPRTPDVDGSGLILPTEGSIFLVTVSMKVGSGGKEIFEADLEALPEAAPGSDAALIGRGIKP